MREKAIYETNAKSKATDAYGALVEKLSELVVSRRVEKRAARKAASTAVALAAMDEDADQ